MNRFMGCRFSFLAAVVFGFASLLLAGCRPSNTWMAPPSSVLSVSPASVSINGTGSTNAQNISVQETGYTGTFSQTNTCATMATITPSGTNGSSASFTVTGNAVGTCSATFGDTNNQKITVNIAVTTTGFGIQ